ncbi:helix-turn-helix domain-containing protein [Listeria fleischmannii 1991]|uniref:HTH cro/C1-type domain-containing protein n=2 Tax=Listeria fleischmannii TaxID=1069827 RepID=A0A2X3H3M9_9LIST|nr:helix-turn-helix transcriptional regulator [Listeria fleischmannii]EMG28640.1 helix-turn-helix domain-containing protein [Listeria fleischmannii subsp. fleischmannii LU2006-1]KMT59667.1 helix-turn-helix domain-containing protein [Listeria fleischmannii 1991]SQC67433.1 Uncharacterised protein [Listeria fleischmannii subsp. fleischmannii]
MDEKSIGAFLMSARKRVQPEMVGLTRTKRRRTAGLRREEVAEIANIGVSWYTSIEQGKVAHPSIQVLESIANALLLNTAEKQYLFNLAQTSEQFSHDHIEKFPDAMRAMVVALEPNPVYVINHQWNFIDWNESAALIFNFSSFEKLNIKQPNLLNHFLLSDHMMVLIDEWEMRAKIMIARYRADFLKSPQDPDFLDNIDYLKKESAFFRTEWARNDVRILENSNKKWQHPLIGEVCFDQIILSSPELANYQIMTFMASEETKDKLEQMRKNTN